MFPYLSTTAATELSTATSLVRIHALTREVERIECRPSSIPTSTERPITDGKTENRQDQAAQLRGHGIFLRDQEEPENGDRQAQLPQVRSDCAQARRL